MKKIIAVILAFTLVLSFTGCSLFSDESAVKFDGYTHNDPKDLTYDERIPLKGDGFEKTLQDYINQAAYPDTMKYDDDGNMTGMYDYDPDTGLAKGWTDITTGKYTEFKKGKEVDLGKPDESKMVEIQGTINIAFVVYGNKSKAVSAYMYLFLSDKKAKDVVKENMESMYGISLTEESDTVLKAVEDADFIANEFKNEEEQAGSTIKDKSAKAYADILKQIFNVKEFGKENPYKPYSGHKDPTDVDYDEKVILTGSGDAAVSEEYEGYVTQMTDYVYGKDGEVVAQYTYYECKDKAAADKLLNTQGAMPTTAERVSDTVIRDAKTGKDMQQVISQYMGYNVLKDKKVDTYVKMLEETYFTSVYEK